MRSRSIVVLVAVLASLATPALVVAQPLTATSALVSVGSPADLPPRNGEFEPAVAVDANRPDVLAAGAIDTIDLQACPKNFDQPGCPFTPDVGISGVYFSFDSGHNWTQPTYTGLTQRDCGTVDVCQSHVGTIGTLPWYPESGLVSDADAAVAFGPRPVNGSFSWENGSRLYYANLAHRLSDRRPRKPFNAFESIAVSRLDNPTPDRIQDQDNWFHPAIAATRSSAVTFEDKEQIWADNAESSPFFGNVFVCWTNFNGRSEPIMVSVSRDGGDTWTQKQVTDAGVNLQLGLRQACTIRTDSHGVVYLAYIQIANGTPGIGHHMLVKSFDGGNHWTRPQPFQVMNDACYNVDPFQGRCTHEGPGGARNDLAAAPSLDIANGAPTGEDATDEIVDAWSDGRFGLNNEVSLLSYSMDRGRTWSEPTVASVSGDRALYTAPAISPNGADLYLAYMAYRTPFQTDFVNPRYVHSVFLHSAIGAGGAPAGWTTLVDGPVGDARGATQFFFGLVFEFLGDYVYAAATRDYGVGVATDARGIDECPAVDAYRASVLAGNPTSPPYILTDCPAHFENTDIFAFTTG